MEINEIEILSVGVDVGSSTSHLVFSKLLLKRDERSATRRFNIEQRNIVYEGRIIHTPLLDDNTIDIARLTEFFKEEYRRAEIDPADIQTGAVIVTGESARKQNARQIAAALSHDAGRFVAGQPRDPGNLTKPSCLATSAVEPQTWPLPSMGRPLQPAASRSEGDCWALTAKEKSGGSTRLRPESWPISA